MCFKGMGSLAQITVCMHQPVNTTSTAGHDLNYPLTHPDLSLITPLLETWDSWEEQFILNKLAETSSSEHQHRSFGAQAPVGSGRRKSSSRHRPRQAAAARDTWASTFSSLDFVNTFATSASSIRPTHLAGLPFYAVYFLMDSSST